MTARSCGDGRKSPARWRKVKLTFLSELPSFQLWRDGERLATVAQLPNKRWYWYGGGTNTLDDAITFATQEAAQSDAKARCS